jgi:hypothetical protein
MVSYGKIIRPNGGPPESDEFISWDCERILQSISDSGNDERNELQLVDDFSISLNGSPGRALKILQPDGSVINVRIYYSNGVTYTLLVSENEEARAERFLESFKFL